MTPTSFRRFLPGSGSLGARAIRASGWALFLVFASHGLRLVSNLIMTRILVPEAFGLMAMVGTTITAFMLLSDIGVDRSIQREVDGAEPHFLRVAWVVKIMRSGFVTAGVCTVALLLGILGPVYAVPGTIYADPRLPWLIALSALSVVFYGGESTTKDLAQRRLELGRLTALEIAAQVLQILAMVAFAQLSATVWALMAGMLTATAIKAVASHFVFRGPTMRFAWDREIVDRLWDYGKWLMGSSVLTFFALNADRIILGSLLNATGFGIYSIARIWIDAGQQIVSRLTGQVGFASFGEVVRDRPQELRRLFRKFQTVIDVLCAISFGAAFFFGPLLLDWLYTDVYAQAGDYIRILSVILLVQRFNPLGELIMNLGNSRAIMVISAFRAAALCASLPLAFNAFGLTGALYAVAVSPLVSVPYTLWVLVPTLGRQLLVDVAWTVAIILIIVGHAAF